MTKPQRFFVKTYKMYIKMPQSEEHSINLNFCSFCYGYANDYVIPATDFTVKKDLTSLVMKT